MDVLIPRNIIKKELAFRKSSATPTLFMWIQTSCLRSRPVLLNDKLRFLLERVNTLDKTNRS